MYDAGLLRQYVALCIYIITRYLKVMFQFMFSFGK